MKSVMKGGGLTEGEWMWDGVGDQPACKEKLLFIASEKSCHTGEKGRDGKQRKRDREQCRVKE